MQRLVVAATAVVVAFVLGVSAPRTAAEDAPAKKKEKAPPAYVGSDTCKTCHFTQARYWKKTRLPKALESLKPTPEKDKALYDAKKAAGLDPAKDYSTDASCLACHTTGYGKKGGYPVDPAASAEAKAAAEAMAGIGCEACHGPGGDYAKHKSETLKKDENAKFTFEGLAERGLVKPDEKLCATCHNDTNPTHASDPFEFAKSKDKVHTKPKKKKKPKKAKK